MNWLRFFCRTGDNHAGNQEPLSEVRTTLERFPRLPTSSRFKPDPLPRLLPNVSDAEATLPLGADDADPMGGPAVRSAEDFNTWLASNPCPIPARSPDTPTLVDAIQGSDPDYDVARR